MTSFPNGYDLRFLLPRDYEYDPNFLNAMSSSYFMELYGPAIENRITLRYDIHKFLLNTIEMALYTVQADDMRSRTEKFFDVLYAVPRPEHLGDMRYIASESATSMRITEYLRKSEGISWEERRKHSRDWGELENYLDVTVTVFLRQLFDPTHVYRNDLLGKAAYGRALCMRMFAMRMGQVPAQA